MGKFAAIVGQITSTEAKHALTPSPSASFFYHQDRRTVLACDYPNMHFEAILIPGLTSGTYSSAQVGQDLYLIS